MREMSAQREIVVPRDMRAARGGAAKPSRRVTNPIKGKVSPGEFAAALRGAGGWMLAQCAHRPGETAGTLVALGAAVYVSLNALGFQAGRHPAPILPQPAMQAAKPAPVRIVSTDAPAVKAEPEAAAKEALRAASHDSIGALIRSPGDTTSSVTPKPDTSVAKAQRALTKLGYGPLKDDGVMGSGTKAAIEKFEREHKLPVKGEAAGRTLRELATRAGKAKG